MSHEAVYTRVLYPLPASRIWPVTVARAVLQTHQRIGRVTQRGSAPTPVRGNGQHQLTAPEDVG